MYVVATDAQGRFSFPPPDRAFKVVAVGEAGIAETDEAATIDSPEIHLQAWGQLEGVVYAGKDPVPNQQVQVYECRDGLGYDPNAVRIQYDNEGRTDGQGRFLFRKVRPGPTAIQSKGRRQVVEVTPGQTTQLRLGGGGRKARAHLGVADGTPALDLTKASVTIRPAGYRSLADLTITYPDNYLLMDPARQRAWWTAWSQTPEGRRFEQASNREPGEAANRSTAVEIVGEELHITDILPGRYTVEMHFRECDPAVWGNRSTITALEQAFEVPDAQGEAYDAEVVDLGKIPVRAIASAKAHCPAPPAAIDTLDGRKIRLSDLQGRFILLDILDAPWSQETAARHKVLRQVHATYSGSGRLEIISVLPNAWPAAAAMAGPLQAFASKSQLPWTVGIISDSHTREFFEGYYRPSGADNQGDYRSCVLIGPDGTVLALDVQPDQLIEVVTKALQGP